MITNSNYKEKAQKRHIKKSTKKDTSRKAQKKKH